MRGIRWRNAVGDISNPFQCGNLVFLCFLHFYRDFHLFFIARSYLFGHKSYFPCGESDPLEEKVCSPFRLKAMRELRCLAFFEFSFFFDDERSSVKRAFGMSQNQRGRYLCCGRGGSLEEHNCRGVVRWTCRNSGVSFSFHFKKQSSAKESFFSS